MRQSRLAVVAALSLVAAAIAAPSGAGAETASKAAGNGAVPGVARDASTKHDFRSPMQVKQDALKQKALGQALNGTATARGANQVVRVGKGQYVELERESTDRIFVVLAEFGDQRHELYPDQDTDPATPGPVRFDGPLHNQIPEPDRAVNNSSLWQPEYEKAHYEDMYFNRMAEYYENQSSGRYSVEGDVTEWVKVPFNEARYGRSPDVNDECGDIVCPNTWLLIRDALAVWTQGQLDAGQTMEQIQEYLRTFDVQDRYDFDGDGEFKEPDGYIDHFQIVHAGGDEAAIDPVFGEDAIWSHRWFASNNSFGTGPEGGAQFGGTEVGEGAEDSGQTLPDNPTGVWVGDYTIQPEDGGLGVFAHEFGHDLGLPDLYDTSGNTGGAENSTGFWTLMSSGANIGDGRPDGIGDAPVDLGTWEKLQLGWLNYELAFAGEKSHHRMGPSIFNTRQAQAVIVVLPDKEVPLQLGAPCTGCGSRYFYSDNGDDLNNTMTLPVAGGGPLTAQVRYDTEEDWDYAFLEASSDAGATWTPVLTNLSDSEGDQSGFNGSGTGITGASAGWVPLTAELPAGTNQVRFRYQTDGAFVLPGFQVDNIAVGGTVVGTAETDTEGWVLDGFFTTTGSEIQIFPNYYIAENRQYLSHDRSLRTAYNFGFLDSRPDWVENFRYQDGLLINYWDLSQDDNNVGDHPGQGLILPVDAHPRFFHSYDGQLWRPRVLSFDSTFGLERTDVIRLHKDSRRTTIPSQRAQPVFDDTKTWWFDADRHAATGAHVGRYQPGWVGVDVPKTGTVIEVRNVDRSKFMQIRVRPK